MQANHDTLLAVLTLLQIVTIAFAAYRGVFSRGAEDAALRQRVNQIEKWIEAHQVCNRKQIEILDELREGLSYIKGKLSQ